MRENHKNFRKDFFWKFLDQAGLGLTILVSTGVARPSEQWWTRLEKKKKKEADLVALVAHGDAGGCSWWCCCWWIGWRTG